MQNRLLLPIGTLAFLGTAILGAQVPQTGTLRGTVTRASTTEGIPDAQVLVTNGSIGPRGQVRGGLPGGTAPRQFNATSDREGHFVVKDVPPGTYRVRIQRDGYFGAKSGETSPAYVDTVTTVSASPNSSELKVSLTPGAVIAGRVTNSSGTPLAGMTIQGYNLTYQGGPILQAVMGTTTDDRGDFRLFAVPPGDYYLALTPGQLVPPSAGGGFGGGRSGRGSIGASDSIVRTLYPDALEVKNARLISVRGGEELSGMNISARSSASYKISGRIVSNVPLAERVTAQGDRMPLAAQLTLYPRDKNVAVDANARNATRVAIDSTFELTGVTADSYDLYVRVPNGPAAAAAAAPGTVPSVFFGRTTVDVGNQDLQDISIFINPGVEVRAYATVDGSPTTAANNVRAIIQSDDSARFVSNYSNSVGYTGVAAADGSITFQSVNEGSYRFQVILLVGSGAGAARGQRGAAPTGVLNFDNAYVDDIREGGLSVYDTGLVVGKQSPQQIEIIAKTNGGTIQGTTLDSKQQLKPGAEVVLVPSDSHRKNPALYKTAVSDQTGQFTLRGVRPGQYKLFAFENRPTNYQDPALYPQYETHGSSITVIASSAINTQVSVIPTER